MSKKEVKEIKIKLDGELNINLDDGTVVTDQFYVELRKKRDAQNRELEQFCKDYFNKKPQSDYDRAMGVI